MIRSQKLPIAVLPTGAVLILAFTLMLCLWLARTADHISPLDHHWPTISALGVEMPERAFFSVGFSLVILLLAATVWGRLRQVAKLFAYGRVVVFALGAVFAASLLCLLAMAWIPADRGPIHFYAAVSALGLLALFELGHAAACVVMLCIPRIKALPQTMGPLETAWLFLCPIGAIYFVASWVNGGGAVPQYLAVLCNVGYFLSWTRALGGLRRERAA